MNIEMSENSAKQVWNFWCYVSCSIHNVCKNNFSDSRKFNNFIHLSKNRQGVFWEISYKTAGSPPEKMCNCLNLQRREASPSQCWQKEVEKWRKWKKEKKKRKILISGRCKALGGAGSGWAAVRETSDAIEVVAVAPATLPTSAAPSWRWARKFLVK